MFRDLSLETRIELADKRAARFLDLSISANSAGKYELALANAEAYGRWERVALALRQKSHRGILAATGII